MKRTRIAALALSLLFLGAALPVSAGQVQPVNTMTPYDTYVEPDTFLNGAVLDLKKTGDVPAFSEAGTGEHAILLQHQHGQSLWLEWL